MRKRIMTVIEEENVLTHEIVSGGCKKLMYKSYTEPPNEMECARNVHGYRHYCESRYMTLLSLKRQLSSKNFSFHD